MGNSKIERWKVERAKGSTWIKLDSIFFAALATKWHERRLYA